MNGFLVINQRLCYFRCCWYKDARWNHEKPSINTMEFLSSESKTNVRMINMIRECFADHNTYIHITILHSNRTFVIFKKWDISLFWIFLDCEISISIVLNTSHTYLIAFHDRNRKVVSDRYNYYRIYVIHSK